MNNELFARARIRVAVVLLATIFIAFPSAMSQEDSASNSAASSTRKSEVRVRSNLTLKLDDDRAYFVNLNHHTSSQDDKLIPIEPGRNYRPVWDDEEIECYGPFLEREQVVARVKPIEDVDFSELDLSYAIFKGKFINCSFVKTNLSHANVSEAEFVDCDFTGADVRYIKGLRMSVDRFLTLREPSTGLFNLRGAEITVFNDSPSLTVVNLGFSDLSYAKLTKGAASERAGRVYFVLTDCKLDYYQSPVVFGDGRPRTNSVDALDSVKLSALKETQYRSGVGLVSGLTLSGVDRTPLDLSGYTFIDCVFVDCDFDMIKIDDAFFINCVFSESITNLNEDKLKTTTNWKEGKTALMKRR